MSLDDFILKKKLGEGAYSSVYKVKRLSDNKSYALKKVKLLNLSEKEKQNALNEVRIIASIRHPNVVQFKECFIHEESNTLCIIQEYADGGDLLQKIQENQRNQTTFSENEIWNVLIQTVKGVKALHDQNIFHRDLKSANVFLYKDGTAKLGDFNVSKLAKKGLLYTQTGTPYYASPEIWKDQPYDKTSDIWSLGCVIYEMTMLRPPFRAEDMPSLFKKVLKGQYSKIPLQYSVDLNNIIRLMLQVSSHLRPSCDKILRIPFIVKHMEEKHFVQANGDEEKSILLQTIKFPKNLGNLPKQLPKPNYNDLKIRYVDKQTFLDTVSSGQMNSTKSTNQNYDPFQSEGNLNNQSVQRKQNQNNSVKLMNNLNGNSNNSNNNKENLQNQLNNNSILEQQDENLQQSQIIQQQQQNNNIINTNNNLPKINNNNSIINNNNYNNNQNIINNNSIIQNESEQQIQQNNISSGQKGSPKLYKYKNNNYSQQQQNYKIKSLSPNYIKNSQISSSNSKSKLHLPQLMNNNNNKKQEINSERQNKFQQQHETSTISQPYLPHNQSLQTNLTNNSIHQNDYTYQNQHSYMSSGNNSVIRQIKVKPGRFRGIGSNKYNSNSPNPQRQASKQGDNYASLERKQQQILYNNNKIKLPILGGRQMNFTNKYGSRSPNTQQDIKIKLEGMGINKLQDISQKKGKQY